ncbi:hypothetical protein [Actibacterium sp. MT2.3-13A]|uniref:hypothetical protein n=1 Tax=Actibacterium sp. MT2.3-13A TaxID=2828332 RepID=UPI001BAA2075|nr:hypothetical protein [Actibacterium sp. MT2.3-13A]
MRRLILLLVLPLAACATPRQQCESAATQDLRIIDALIVETEQNIARGYRLERETTTRPRLTFCYAGHPYRRERFGMVFCNTTETVVTERPVAIDLKAERAKLASLKAKRPEAAQRAARALAACRDQFPEG